LKRVMPSEIDGRVRAPPSKSMTQRAVFLASLAEGESTILVPSMCGDAASSMRVALGLGAEIRADAGNLVVIGGASNVSGGILDCGESGFCARAAIPIAATFKAKFTVDGRGTLAKRPVGPVEAAMRSLGAECRTADGRLPAIVEGPMKGGRAKVDGSSGSQFLSGLLMALPPCPKDSQLSVSGLKSKPYALMTIDMAKKFGAKVKCDNKHSTFAIEGSQALKPARVAIEGDWSGAAFLLVAGALAGRAKVSNLNLKSLQADRTIVGVLKDAGAKVKAADNSVAVERAQLGGFDFDASDCPDLIPPLVVLATGCKGVTAIAGADRLRGKESDRAAALYRQFKNIGADIKVDDDKIIVRGCNLRGGSADSGGDHRMAMALAIAGVVSGKGVAIRGHECVSKSYPGFFGDLARLAVVK
jgi:3-phosphoshikimate 1-carboxyvinyltransferase